ncbi:hypothetical protein BC332_22204 [Capsicum chinense]|nr:hypothetical protein BC332_22204 [Capsicum chinense]
MGTLGLRGLGCPSRPGPSSGRDKNGIRVAPVSALPMWTTNQPCQCGPQIPVRQGKPQRGRDAKYITVLDKEYLGPSWFGISVAARASARVVTKNSHLLRFLSLHICGLLMWIWFPEVAKLDYDWCLDIQGTIRAGVLSPRTSYATYFVYKLKNESEFHLRPVNVSVGIFGVKLETRLAFLVPVKDRPQHRNHIDAEDVSEPKPKPEQLDDDFEESIAEEYRRLLDRLWQHIPENATGSVRSIVQRPKLRDDGWLEVELGEFYTENEEDCIEMNLNEVDDCAFLKKGLIIEGIEIRPRMG